MHTYLGIQIGTKYKEFCMYSTRWSNLPITPNANWLIFVPSVIQPASVNEVQFIPAQKKINLLISYEQRCMQQDNDFLPKPDGEKKREESRWFNSLLPLLPFHKYQSTFTYLLIQSILNTPLSVFAVNPGGSTHRIGGWLRSDSAVILAKP